MTLYPLHWSGEDLIIFQLDSTWVKWAGFTTEKNGLSCWRGFLSQYTTVSGKSSRDQTKGMFFNVNDDVN